MAPNTDAPSRSDLMMTSIFLGMFLGFGCFVTYHTILETRRANRFATHVILCWAEIFAGIVFAVTAYFYNAKVLRPSFGLFFGMISAWAIQVHCLLQIIVSRISVLVPPSTGRRLKLSVAIMWTIICAIVYCIWIPAQLKINPRFVIMNFYCAYTERILFLLTDAALNFTFIYTVKTRLVQHGLTKYNRLVRFNQSIVIVSLATDCLLVGLMSLPDRFVYAQFSSVAFIVKLDIEIAMFRLIAKVAQSTGLTEENEFHIPSLAIGGAGAMQTHHTHIIMSLMEDHEQ